MTVPLVFSESALSYGKKSISRLQTFVSKKQLHVERKLFVNLIFNLRSASYAAFCKNCLGSEYLKSNVKSNTFAIQYITVYVTPVDHISLGNLFSSGLF